MNRLLAAAAALIIAGVLSAATVLLRSAGVALPTAALLYRAYRRRWKQALLFSLVVGGSLAPWQWYSRTHRPSEQQQLAHGGAHAMTYRETFWQRWAGDRASGTIGIAELPARVFANAVDVSGRAIGGVMAPAIFRGPSESGQEIVALGGARGFRAGSMGAAPGAMAISLVLSLMVAAGWLRHVPAAPPDRRGVHAPGLTGHRPALAALDLPLRAAARAVSLLLRRKRRRAAGPPRLSGSRALVASVEACSSTASTSA